MTKDYGDHLHMGATHRRQMACMRQELKMIMINTKLHTFIDIICVYTCYTYIFKNTYIYVNKNSIL